MNGDFRMDSKSPETPLSHKVHEHALLNPPVVHMHKMNLRDFDEMVSSRHRSNSGTPNPPPLQQRPASVCGFSNGSRPSSRMSSKESSCGDFAYVADDLLRPATSYGEQVRPLSRSEFSQRNKTATDWFRASQAINNSTRSTEETDALLAAARDRRRHGVSVVTRSRSVSKTAVVCLADDFGPLFRERAETEPVQGQSRRMLDPAVLWGAKPIWDKAQAAKEKPRTPPIDRNRSGVAVGLEGEDSLRALLSRRQASK